MTSETVACYRLYAANCIELAERIADPDRRVFLFSMARDWLKLAKQAEQNGASGREEPAAHPDSRPEPPAAR